MTKMTFYLSTHHCPLCIYMKCKQYEPIMRTKADASPVQVLSFHSAHREFNDRSYHYPYHETHSFPTN